MELRYPISLNPSATIFVLAFAEGGNNWGTFKDFNPFSLYRSVGGGVRIFMPAFGLLGIDYGYGFDPVIGAPGVNGGQFHFTIGQQIR
jgi:outer membrane protein insertion porin family